MIEALTPTQYNRELAIIQTKAARHYAITQNECYHKFWNRDPQVILDSINSNIPLTLERFEGNTELGLAVNKQLEKTDVGERCIVTMPQGYSFNGSVFEYAVPVIITEDIDITETITIQTDDTLY
jgi:hypothetical protein